MLSLSPKRIRGIGVPCLTIVAAFTSVYSTFPSSAQASAEAVTTSSTELAASPSSTSYVTSSTGGLGPQFIDCTYDVILPDGGSFSSLSFKVGGNSAFDPGLSGCELPPDGPLASLDLEVENYIANHLNGIVAPLPTGSTLVRCEGTDLVEGGAWSGLDYDDLHTWALAAKDLDGTPVQPPRLCATKINCESEGTYNLSWKGEPECGDANYDTVVKSGDALAALRTAVGLPSCVPYPASCDTDSDGSILALDALRILRRAVGLLVELDCPVPCHPGTIGPPGENRQFTVEVSLAIDPEEALTFKLTPDEGEFSAPQDVECVNVSGIPRSIDSEGVLTGTVHSGFSGPTALLYCRYRVVGSAFPDVSDFTIVTTNKADDVIEGAVRITSIRYGW